MFSVASTTPQAIIYNTPPGDTDSYEMPPLDTTTYEIISGDKNAYENVEVPHPATNKIPHLDTTPYDNIPADINEYDLPHLNTMYEMPRRSTTADEITPDIRTY